MMFLSSGFPGAWLLLHHHPSVPFSPPLWTQYPVVTVFLFPACLGSPLSLAFYLGPLSSSVMDGEASSFLHPSIPLSPLFLMSSPVLSPSSWCQVASAPHHHLSCARTSHLLFSAIVGALASEERSS